MPTGPASSGAHADRAGVRVQEPEAVGAEHGDPARRRAGDHPLFQGPTGLAQLPVARGEDDRVAHPRGRRVVENGLHRLGRHHDERDVRRLV